MAILHIDLDDTTVDFIDSVRRLHNSTRPESEHVLLESLNSWERNGDFLSPYYEHEGLYYNLAIKDNAVEVLEELSKRHDVRFLTAFPTAQSAMDKIRFVEDFFPFIGVKNTTLTWQKGQVVGDLLFDDSPEFLPTFDGLKVLFNTQYNAHVQADAKVSNWLEFYRVVEDFEKQGLLIPSKSLIL